MKSRLKGINPKIIKITMLRPQEMGPICLSVVHLIHSSLAKTYKAEKLVIIAIIRGILTVFDFFKKIISITAEMESIVLF